MARPLHHLQPSVPTHIYAVGATRPLLWLMKACADIRAAPLCSLVHGLVFAVLGYAMLTYAWSTPHLLAAAVCGFMLIGPLAAAGLYEVSRRREQGLRTSFWQSFRAWVVNAESLFYYGIMLALVALAWERLSAILFTVFYYGTAPTSPAFYRELFLSGDYNYFVSVYVIAAGLVGAVVFTISAVSVPMLMDRDVDVLTAMMTSAQAVGHNLPAMLVWAVVLVALMALGVATMMLGMVLLIPLAGHASWHAYRDLVHN